MRRILRQFVVLMTLFVVLGLLHFTGPVQENLTVHNDATAVAKKSKKLARNSTSRARITQLVQAKNYTPMTPAQAKRVVARGPAPKVVRAEQNIRYYKREPANLKGYRAMFNKVPVRRWGGADVSISVRLADGRRVWLFGDTISVDHGFVHSTALVQDGKKLHVSNRGHQLLPDDPATEDTAKYMYWIEAAESLRHNYLVVTAAPMWAKAGVWNFGYRAERSRRALLHVDTKNNVRFVHWIDYVPRPETGMDGEDFASPRPGQYTYAHFVHPIKLRNGKFVKTVNRNYDTTPRRKNGLIAYKKYRPLIQRSNTRDNPYWGH